MESRLCLVSVSPHGSEVTPCPFTLVSQTPRDRVIASTNNAQNIVTPRKQSFSHMQQFPHDFRVTVALSLPPEPAPCPHLRADGIAPHSWAGRLSQSPAEGPCRVSRPGSPCAHLSPIPWSPALSTHTPVPRSVCLAWLPWGLFCILTLFLAIPAPGSCWAWRLPLRPTSCSLSSHAITHSTTFLFAICTQSVGRGGGSWHTVGLGLTVQLLNT